MSRHVRGRGPLACAAAACEGCTDCEPSAAVGILTTNDLAALEAERTNYAAKLLRSGNEHAVWGHVERLLATIAARDAEIARLRDGISKWQDRHQAVADQHNAALSRVAQLESEAARVAQLALDAEEERRAEVERYRFDATDTLPRACNRVAQLEAEIDAARKMHEDAERRVVAWHRKSDAKTERIARAEARVVQLEADLASLGDAHVAAGGQVGRQQNRIEQLEAALREAYDRGYRKGQEDRK